MLQSLNCPFLAHTKLATLRRLSTAASTRHPNISKLTAKATKCPVMAPALVVQSAQYASIAKDIPVSKKCPHEAAPNAGNNASKTPNGFDYSAFCRAELQKKHDDKSYRYFNNINRLAQQFPVAHTGNTSEKVDVWCSNDYLGMSKNPVLLQSMQSVYALSRLLYAC